MPFRKESEIPAWWRMRWAWEMLTLLVILVVLLEGWWAARGTRALLIAHIRTQNDRSAQVDKRFLEARQDLAYLKGRQDAFNTAQIHLLDAVNGAIRVADKQNTRRLVRTERLSARAAARVATVQKQVRELQRQTGRVERRLHRSQR